MGKGKGRGPRVLMGLADLLRDKLREREGVVFDVFCYVVSSVCPFLCWNSGYGPQQFKFDFQLFQHHRIESILNLSLSLAETIISNSKDL